MTTSKTVTDFKLGPAKASTPLPTAALRWRCDPAAIPSLGTDVVEPVEGVVGQDTAVEAMKYGLATRAPGQNIFVRGETGTGRLTLVRRLLANVKVTETEAKDCCYVHNFSQPECPQLIAVAPGDGPKFRRRMDKLADFIRDSLATALASEEVNARRNVIEQNTRDSLRQVVDPFEVDLQDAGLTLVTVEAGPVVQTVIFPLVEGRAVAPEEYEKLHTQGDVTDAAYKAVRNSLSKFEQSLPDISNRANEVRRKHDEAMSKLLSESAMSILDKAVRVVLSAFQQPEVEAFVSEVIEDVVENRLDDLNDEVDFSSLYRVNVISEHRRSGACPVIIEHTPTARNLMGTIDQVGDNSEPSNPSHMGIRAGSLLRADGGYLVLEARELLDEGEAWKALKRVLRTGRLEISPVETALSSGSPALKPESIEIRVRVILLGDPETYYLLDEHDSDFPQLFKVLADFDEVLPRDANGINYYAAILSRIVQNEDLPRFDGTAIAALAEHGARIASKNGKLSARFGQIADVAREAAFIAQGNGLAGGTNGKNAVTAEHVRNTVLRRKRRADLPSRRFRELIADRTIRVDTSGSVVGQVNALAVMQAGPMVYGFPSRLTATIGPGNSGVINIDREAALSGAIHTKGFYILRGLLRFLLRTDHPLAFDASVAFEQSYGAIDGDSASGAEICCLLSALTDVPLKQTIAMTGAIDQMGHILAIGAVNEKIEGFFDACRDTGASADQGVIIPRANAGDLMLRQDIVDACAAGEFRVFAVDTLREALSILTGWEAGTRGPDGTYPNGSLLSVAVARAHEYWQKAVRPAPAISEDSEVDEPVAAKMEVSKPAPKKTVTAPKKPAAKRAAKKAPKRAVKRVARPKAKKKVARKTAKKSVKKAAGKTKSSAAKTSKKKKKRR